MPIGATKTFRASFFLLLLGSYFTITLKSGLYSCIVLDNPNSTTSFFQLQWIVSINLFFSSLNLSEAWVGVFFFSLEIFLCFSNNKMATKNQLANKQKRKKRKKSKSIGNILRCRFFEKLLFKTNNANIIFEKIKEKKFCFEYIWKSFTKKIK